MRAIHLAHLDKTRPVLVLTRELALGAMTSLTVAPITSTIKGFSTEVLVGSDEGLEDACAVSCDDVVTIPASRLGRLIGHLPESKEPALAQAMVNAFDLRVEDL